MMIMSCKNSQYIIWSTGIIIARFDVTATKDIEHHIPLVIGPPGRTSIALWTLTETVPSVVLKKQHTQVLFDGTIQHLFEPREPDHICLGGVVIARKPR